jgi:hypothetical protein
MKKTLIPLLAILCSLTTSAQRFKRTDSTDLLFSRAIQTIYFDFANDFRSIQGDLVADEAEYEKYASVVSLPGAQECVITRFHSIIDTTASWQAIMLITDEFSDGKRAYKSVCNRLKNARVVLVDGSEIFFKHDIEEAEEDKRFVTSYFYLPVGNPAFRNVKIEVELITLLGEYKVQVNVHSKPADTLEY